VSIRPVRLNSQTDISIAAVEEITVIRTPHPKTLWLLLAAGTVVLADPAMNTGGQLGTSRTVTTYTMGQGSFNGGVTLQGEYARDAMFLKNSNGTTTEQSMEPLSEDIFLGYGLTNWLDASVDLPFFQDLWSGHWDNSQGVGDLQMALKVEHPGLYREAPFRVGYLLRAELPTGMSDGFYPRHIYQTEGGTNTSNAFAVHELALNPEILWTLDFSKFPSRTPLQINLNAGGVMQIIGSNYSDAQYTAFVGSMDAVYQFNPSVGAFWEFGGESNLQNFLKNFDVVSTWNKSIVRTTVGATWKAPSGLYASLGLDVGLNDDAPQTAWARTNDARALQHYSTTTTPQVGLNLTIGFGAKGAHAVPFLGRFFAPEDTVRVRDTLELVKNDTVRVIKNDTVVVIKKDTMHVVSGQNPKNKINYGILVFRTINFQSGSAELLPSSYKSLDDIAQSLRTYPEVCLQVSGYTDATGTAEFNRRLSLARAQSVVDYLVQHGVAADRLRAEAGGSSDPVANNDTDEGRLLNRRVEMRRIDLPTPGK